MGISRVAATASLFVIALALTGRALANDSSVSCKSPPKESASVAFHPGSQVTFTQDRQNNTCTFSVNGAVATSPPAEQVMAALNVFRSGHEPALTDMKTMAGAIAALMSAAAPVEQVPDDLVAVLTKAGNGLTGCLVEFFDKKVLPSVEFKEIKFSCKGLRPYKEHADKVQLMGAGVPAVAVPTLMISVEWQQGRFFSALYLPQEIVHMPPLR